MEHQDSYWYYSPVMKCKHCPESISLPYSDLCFEFGPENDPSSEEEDGDQPLWPSAAWRALFGCISCGHVFDYTGVDVHFDLVPKLARGKYSSGANCFYAEFQCANKGCKLPVKLHIETTRSNESGILKLLRLPFFVGDLPCGHPILPVPEKEYKIHRILTTMWEPS